MTDLAGDFGRCVVCGKEYQIYGSDGFCDDCMCDIIDVYCDNQEAAQRDCVKCGDIHCQDYNEAAKGGCGVTSIPGTNFTLCKPLIRASITRRKGDD